MKVMTATELSRNLSRVLDSLQNGTEEIIIIRKKDPVARLIPGTPQMTALEALSDLYRTLPDQEGKNWYKDARRGSRRARKEIQDPWR
jgi:antitoxin (DNA-binding transcriptional repressor) of toxin-antitoxin stability system